MREMSDVQILRECESFPYFRWKLAPMRKNLLTALLVLGLGITVQGQQGDWALMPYGSHQIMFGDTDFDHPTKAISPGVGFALQWGWTDHLRVYGDASYGSVNGGGTQYYFENQYLMGLMGIQWDGFGQFFPDQKLQIFGDGSIGWSYFQSARFNTNTGALEARVPAEGAFSASPIIGIGTGLAYPVSNQVDLYVGYKTFWMYENDWGDANESGEATDYVGQLSFGIRFAIDGHEKMAKVPQSEYDDLVAAKKRAEQERDEAREELETARSRYDTQIEDLYNVLSIMNNNIDSLEQKITVLRQDPDGGVNDYVVENADGDVTTPNESTALWRIVIGSFPDAKRANEFAAQRVVEGGEYQVVFIQDLNTYRVVYNSYGSLNRAKADLERVKTVITNAWIIRF